MLWFNACPHCKTGTVEMRSDSDGRYLQCLACAWTLYEGTYGRVGATKQATGTGNSVGKGEKPAQAKETRQRKRRDSRRREDVETAA